MVSTCKTKVERQMTKLYFFIFMEVYMTEFIFKSWWSFKGIMNEEDLKCNVHSNNIVEHFLPFLINEIRHNKNGKNSQ